MVAFGQPSPHVKRPTHAMPCMASQVPGVAALKSSQQSHLIGARRSQYRVGTTSIGAWNKSSREPQVPASRLRGKVSPILSYQRDRSVVCFYSPNSREQRRVGNRKWARCVTSMLCYKLPLLLHLVNPSSQHMKPESVVHRCGTAACTLGDSPTLLWVHVAHLTP